MKAKTSERITLRDIFRFLLRAEKDYPCDLKSDRLIKIVGDSLHLTNSQVRRALRRLERGGFIEVAREDGIVIRRVEIQNRNWKEVPATEAE